jgi:hypothetical protein
MIYNPKFLGKYVIYMWVTDHAGIYGVVGKSITDSKTKGLVIRDTRKPWIVLSKNDKTTNNIECGSTYTDAGAIILHDDFWPKPWNSKRDLTSENSVNAKTCVASTPSATTARTSPRTWSPRGPPARLLRNMAANRPTLLLNPRLYCNYKH